MLLHSWDNAMRHQVYYVLLLIVVKYAVLDKKTLEDRVFLKVLHLI